MKRIPILATFVIVTSGWAHPGVGIVQDSSGNVFYTDLAQVWKVAPDGTKSIAVHNVHTHELCLDERDRLYGEHLWYEGEAIDRWGHRVWRLDPDGTLTDVIPPTEGFLRNYSFVRDRDGAMYWAERGPKTEIRKRLPDGTVVRHAAGPFLDVRWMSATPEGTVFLIDGPDLKRISPSGAVTTMARDLRGGLLQWLGLSRTSTGLWLGRHALMGLWSDRHDGVYVASSERGMVLHVSPHQQVTIVAISRWPWSPSGGIMGLDGDLWLLEYSITNSARARRIRKDGSEIAY